MRPDSASDSQSPLEWIRSLPAQVIGPRWRSTSAHGSILRGMVAVTIFAGLGKIAGAAKEMAVAWRYGVSAEVDAYLFVLNLINWPVAIWFAVLTGILIPMAARIREESPERLRVFRAELLALTLGLGVLLALFAWLVLPSLLSSRLVGLPPHTAQLAMQAIPVLAWLLVPGLLVGLYSTWTMSEGSHTNTLFEGMPALAILVPVLFMGGIEPLIWGTLVGTTLQFLLLYAPSLQRSAPDLPLRPRASAEWTLFWRSFGVMMVGQAVMSLTTIIDQFFAARLGEGAISSIGYATRIIALVLGIVATAVTRATLPVFASSGANNRAQARQIAFRWAGMLFLGGAVVAGIGWLLAPFAVRMLYQRGTFSSSDTVVVAGLLRYGLLHLPFYFASLVLVSLHSSLGNYKMLLLSGVLGLTMKAIASVALIGTFGVGALMLSLVAVYAANTLFLAKVMPR